ncbi:unnamed protein product [Mytilus coruscus]|uniref:HeH/LEM domain-containing protein n=1 Tax=Mytilus coruscus TaxID=42192 RepID=A0A6J8BVB1_MYTCO|nr:unnamed protein product [Mytilus coruscus]
MTKKKKKRQREDKKRKIDEKKSGPPEKMTVQILKSLLKENGVRFSSKDKKADLVKLVKEKISSSNPSRGSRSRQYLNRIERTVQMVHKFVSASKENIQARISPSNVDGIADRLSTTFESNKRLGTSKEVKREAYRRVGDKDNLFSRSYHQRYPDAEMTPSKRVPSKLSLEWSWEQLKNFLLESFPVLKKVQFGLFLVDKSYPLPNDANSPSRIKTYMERENKSGSPFIRPISDISALCIEELTCNLNCSLNNRSTLITPLQTSGSFDSTLPRISIRTSTVTSGEDETITVEDGKIMAAVVMKDHVANASRNINQATAFITVDQINWIAKEMHSNKVIKGENKHQTVCAQHRR